ncbi:MAG: NAD(P)H-binding protein [Candidatus Dormibacter sp.]|uniref:SDR family oxidoreductase n=1 Tax=Candidatus Dormibacter sp. TaxID=2973982 RepID=UPI000DB665AF|nr:MAG: hypothetical protein DLM66_02655 [Candidatus Dormibacteraeota bacterium]
MILVTGGSGFVGRHVVGRLAAEGKPVRALVRDSRSVALAPAVEVFEGDLTRPKTFRAALTGVDVLIHAAALTGDRKEPYRGAYDQVNCVGTERLLAAAKRAGVGKVVLISGLGTKPGRPGSYMSTRWAMEEAVRHSGIPYVILQPSVLIGEGAAFVKGLAKVVRASPLAPAIGWELKFQPLWINDFSRCITAAAESQGLNGRELALGGAEQISMRELMTFIAQSLGRRAWVVPVPVFAAKLQARAMNRILSQPPLTPAGAELFSFDNTTALDSVEAAFGFQPRGLREHVLAHGLELDAAAAGRSAAPGTAATADAGSSQAAEVAGAGEPRAAQPAPAVAGDVDGSAPRGASGSAPTPSQDGLPPEPASSGAGVAAGDEKESAETASSTRGEEPSASPRQTSAETIELIQLAEPRAAEPSVARPSSPTVSNNQGATSTTTGGGNKPGGTDRGWGAPGSRSIAGSGCGDSRPPASMAPEAIDEGAAPAPAPAGADDRPPTARKRRDRVASRGRKPKRD